MVFLAPCSVIFSIFEYTVSSRKYTPPIFAHYCEAKWGLAFCSNIHLVSCIHPLPHLVPHDVKCEVEKDNDCCGFLDEWQLC